jgi:choline dehydrogenase-like flavoprotein
MAVTYEDSADIVVVGSGPGGAITACLLAEAGRDVLLIEEGPHLSLESTPPFSSSEMQQKYRNGGLTVAMGKPTVAYAEACCVGGGSEINSGLYQRTPPEILEEWREAFAVQELSMSHLEPHFDACERDLSVSHLRGAPPSASLKLSDGASRLGWKCSEAPRWYRYEPGDDPGGRPQGSRQSMTRTFIPRAMRAGCRVSADTRVCGLVRHGGSWAVRCETTGKAHSRRSFSIRARTVFLSCGAIQTPLLLRRSGIVKNVGDTLRLHPMVKVVARFDDVVNAEDMGVPVHQVKEFAPHTTLGCSISAPPHLAMALAQHSATPPPVPENWRHMAVYYAMTGGGSGRVRPVPFFRDPLVRFKLTAAHLSELANGLRRLCECLLAAGATVLYPTVMGSEAVTGEAQVRALPAALPPNSTSLMTVHAFSTCPMGEDRTRCAVDSFGSVHDVPNLHVADGSLLCGPPGVNPQGSIMALARRNALRFLELA